MAYDAEIRRWSPNLVYDVRATPGAADAILRDLALAPPARPNSMTVSPNWSALWLGPDHWLLLAVTPPAEQVARLKHLQDTAKDVSVVEVSDSYEAFYLLGPEARDVLAQGTPFNLHDSAFPENGASFTSLFGQKALVARGADDPGLLVMVPRSFADYVAARFSRALSGLERN